MLSRKSKKYVLRGLDILGRFSANFLQGIDIATYKALFSSEKC